MREPRKNHPESSNKWAEIAVILPLMSGEVIVDIAVFEDGVADVLELSKVSKTGPF